MQMRFPSNSGMLFYPTSSTNPNINYGYNPLLYNSNTTNNNLFNMLPQQQQQPTQSSFLQPSTLGGCNSYLINGNNNMGPFYNNSSQLNQNLGFMQMQQQQNQQQLQFQAQSQLKHQQQMLGQQQSSINDYTPKREKMDSLSLGGSGASKKGDYSNLENI